MQIKISLSSIQVDPNGIGGYEYSVRHIAVQSAHCLKHGKAILLKERCLSIRLVSYPT